MTPGLSIRETIDTIFREESRRVLATLIRLLRDFDLAEDALHDAFAAAMEKWPDEGVPASPRAWLVSTGRFKAIDAMRRRAKFDASLATIADKLDKSSAFELDHEGIEDDRLRLIFTCCHPALSPEARIALTLREVCGLTTEEIAHAFLTAAPTLAQRIVRAKAKIRDAGIPYLVPSAEELPERLGTVLHVIYLVFNEGYSASSGETVTRADLCREGIRLGQLLLDLLPEPEVMGLLALMLLHESRRAARTSPEGDIVLLEDQDRSAWIPTMIEQGVALVERTLASGRAGPYSIQAAISAVHAEAKTAGETRWSEIVGLYDVLLAMEPSPVVELNRAVAMAMRDGPEVGIRIIEGILARGDLAEYHLIYSALGELRRRAGRMAEAHAAFERALELAQQEPERRLLRARLQQVSDRAGGR